MAGNKSPLVKPMMRGEKSPGEKSGSFHNRLVDNGLRCRFSRFLGLVQKRVTIRLQVTQTSVNEFFRPKPLPLGGLQIFVYGAAAPPPPVNEFERWRRTRGQKHWVFEGWFGDSFTSPATM